MLQENYISKNDRIQVVTQGWLILIFVPLLLPGPEFGLSQEPDYSKTSPKWIWGKGDRLGIEKTILHKDFALPKKIDSAELKVVAEYCRGQVLINEKSVIELEPYADCYELDVSTFLKPGSNRVTLDLQGTNGPSAVCVEITEQSRGVRRLLVKSDKSWESEKGDVRLFGSIQPRFWRNVRRSIGIDSLDDYTQWKQALAKKESVFPSTYKIAEGFQLELIHQAAKDEGSWVSMAFDPEGKILIAREDKGIIQIEMNEKQAKRDQASGIVQSVKLVEDSLLECRGLLYAFDSLYVSANNSKGLYRLTDTDKDGVFDEKKLLRVFPGGVGHGRNDLALGPDNRIYLICGDAVDLPKQDVRNFASPLRNGFRGASQREGFLISTDAEGKDWKILSVGMRNPYGVDFHRNGQAFTYDADAEFDMGAPWYRPTRVLQMEPGSDFGWRGVTGSWPPYFPDTPDRAPYSINIGKGSPTAVKFGYRSHFPTPYRDALFILDWAYGRILAIHLTPRGAGYAGSAEVFLKGRPLNVTDLDFGPDGHMYFVTGGRKTQSGLFRVRSIASSRRRQRQKSDQQMAREKFAHESTVRLRELQNSKEWERLWQAIDHPDPFIQNAALTGVEKLLDSNGIERCFAEKSNSKKVWAMMIAIRGTNEAISARILKHLEEIDTENLQTREKLVWLEVARLGRQQLRQSGSTMIFHRIEEVACKWLESKDHAIQLGSARVLETGNSERMVELVLSLLEKEQDQNQKLGLIFVLRNVKTGWDLSKRRRYFRQLNAADHFLGGQGFTGFLQTIRKETVATLSSNEKPSLNDLIEQRESTVKKAYPKRSLVKRWTTSELVKSLGAIRGHAGPAILSTGRRIFEEATCSNCHRVGVTGNLIGPDLTAVGRRFSTADLLDSIINPSNVIAEAYQGLVVELSDGRQLSGRIVPGGDYRSPSIRLATDASSPNRWIEIRKSDIVRQKRSSKSWMPSNLLDQFTEDEIRALIMYIRSGGAEK